MMKKSPPLSRKCASCGIYKPLGAFLALKTGEGAEYGNICATCRKTASAEKSTIKGGHDDSESTFDKYKLDNKMKVSIDIAKKLRFKENQERTKEEILKSEEEKQQKLEKTSNTAKGEKWHRQQQFIDNISGLRKKQSSAESKKQHEVTTTQDKKVTVQKIEQLKEQEDLNREINEVNLSRPYVGTGSEVKLQSRVFREFMQRLGKDAPFIKNLGQLLEKQKAQPLEKEIKKQPSIKEFIQETFNISPKKKG